jgi:hypothetical protein
VVAFFIGDEFVSGDHWCLAAKKALAFTRNSIRSPELAVLLLQFLQPFLLIGCQLG